MTTMMMMMCKRLAQVPMLRVPIYNMKLAMMQKPSIFITFSAHTKMAADKRGQIEVFARTYTTICICICIYIYIYIYIYNNNFCTFIHNLWCQTTKNPIFGMSPPLPWLFPEVSLALAQTRSSLSNGRVQAWNLPRSQKCAMCDSFLT